MISNEAEPAAPQNQPADNWWQRRFGDKGVVQLVFGDDVGPLLAIILVVAACYVLIVKERFDLEGAFIYALFLVIALYFARLR